MFQERACVCVCVCADEIYTYPDIAPGTGASVGLGLADGIHCVWSGEWSGGARAPVGEPRGCVDARLADVINMSHGHLREDCEDCEAGRDVRAYEDADGCMFLGRERRRTRWCLRGCVQYRAARGARMGRVCGSRRHVRIEARASAFADMTIVFQSKGGQRRAVRVCALTSTRIAGMAAYLYIACGAEQGGSRSAHTLHFCVDANVMSPTEGAGLGAGSTLAGRAWGRHWVHVSLRHDPVSVSIARLGDRRGDALGMGCVSWMYQHRGCALMAPYAS
jgi:hypothetical protein